MFLNDNKGCSVNGERAYLRDQLFHTLRNEYQAVERGWRFFSGLRFAILSFTATLQFGLFGGYQFIFTRVEDDKLGNLGEVALLVIPVFGITATLVTALIERRDQAMYAVCLERGASIEEELGIPDGHFRQISNVSSGRLPYTHFIRLLYALLGIAWISLFVRGTVSYFI